MFPGKRFGTAYFVWYGKDGAPTVDNADNYVYAVSNNGHFENGDDYVLGRVLCSKLGEISAADWSFYKGGNGMQDSNWTSSMDAAKPILINPGHSSMTGMTYIEPLHRYVMVLRYGSARMVYADYRTTLPESRGWFLGKGLSLGDGSDD